MSAGAHGCVGDGEIGGKAKGLVFFRDMLDAEYDASRFEEVEVSVPPFSVIATEMFDGFLETNDLHDVARSGRPDEEIARAFQQGGLPSPVLEHLSAIVDRSTVPLAVRSSSVLEDAIFRPFAGVYETKMIPNNQSTPGDRRRKLEQAVKLVYASTFFHDARAYLRASGRSPDEEKMAVIVQEVVGSTYGERFYPVVSGVGRSFNFYPSIGAKVEDGVVNLALGLGKTIVDGGICWSYSPARPKAPPPYGSPVELLRCSQTELWAVHLGALAREDPIAEVEHLVRIDLPTAETDGTLALVASTFDAASDRIVPGTRIPGPRVVNFAPLLVNNALPLNGIVRELLSICERAAGTDVEIEFALAAPTGPDERPRLGFLQVRPMVVCHETVTIEEGELASEDLVLLSSDVMGNGHVHGIRDIVFVKPDEFDARHTRSIADEIEGINARLVDEKRPCLLIGFGRWGSADPWLGIPVDWSQISSAKIIVESTLPSMNVTPSQGSHFFHNLTSFGVSYVSVRHGARPGVDWDWLAGLDRVADGKFVTHVRLGDPLRIKVDGRSGRAGIWR